jgi:cytochrome c oxidase subunit 2
MTRARRIQAAMMMALAGVWAGSAAGAPMAPVRTGFAEGADAIFGWLLLFSVIVFGLVAVTLIGLLVTYGRRSDSDAPERPKNRPGAQLAFTLGPVLLGVIVFYAGLRAYVDSFVAPKSAYEVRVTGKPSSWRFLHRNAVEQTEGVLYVPADRPIRFIMNAEGVTTEEEGTIEAQLHSLFIPELRVKQDIVPGRETEAWFTAPRGEYTLFDAAYRGVDRETMTVTMFAMSDDEFAAEMAKAADWIDLVPADELHYAGLRLYRENCVSCHLLDGGELTGPPTHLTHSLIGQRRPLEGGGDVLVDDAYFRSSIINPSLHIAEGYENAMTNFAGQFKERELLALIEFIKRLDEVVDEQGNELPRETEAVE